MLVPHHLRSETQTVDRALLQLLCDIFTEVLELQSTVIMQGRILGGAQKLCVRSAHNGRDCRAYFYTNPAVNNRSMSITI